MNSIEFPRKHSAIYNYILNYILRRGFRDSDDFALKLTEEAIHQLKRGQFSLEEALRKIRSNFFILNTISHLQFLDRALETRIVELWHALEEHIPLKVSAITVDEIDSFSEVRRISNESVSELVPLVIFEEIIKRRFADIISEPFIVSDWGGEQSDLHTTRLLFNSHRVSAAFLLKGKGTKGPLTPKKCGKNGDQILRLSKQLADVYVIQHVDRIVPEVAEMLVRYLKTGGLLDKHFYCIIDGIDTARILKAYGFLTTE